MSRSLSIYVVLDERIKFEIRTLQEGNANQMVPLYVRVVDGRAFHQAVRTRTLVNPSMWDEKGECIKSRVLCSPEERMRIDDVNSLRTYIFETYNEAKKKGTNEKSNWLATTVDKFYASLGKPKKEKKSLKISFDELYDISLWPISSKFILRIFLLGFRSQCNAIYSSSNAMSAAASVT